jgi:hypothetical protein
LGYGLPDLFLGLIIGSWGDRYGRRYVVPIGFFWASICALLLAIRSTPLISALIITAHAGRWWEVGSTPFEGARIKEWRPHWSILHKSHAEDAALYGSEEEKWKHNPILHPDQGFSSFGLFWNHRKELP